MNLTFGNRRNLSSRDDDTGLTLIELLVVITVLGILATVVVLAIVGLREDTADSACPADFRNLITASESYFVQYDATTIPNAGGSEGYGW